MRVSNTLEKLQKESKIEETAKAAKLQEAGDMMRRYNIHSLVVVNETNELVGIIDAFSCI